MLRSLILFFLCFLPSVGCISSEPTSTEQEHIAQPTPYPTTQPLITEGPTLTPTPPLISTQSLSETVSIQTQTIPLVSATPLQPVAATPTQNSVGLDIDIQEYIASQGTVLYTRREQNNFPLLSWPELPVLNQPIFKTVYGQQIGYLYTSDFAPNLNSTGRYLIVPGVNGESDTTASSTTTWLVDLDTEVFWFSVKWTRAIKNKSLMEAFGFLPI